MRPSRLVLLSFLLIPLGLLVLTSGFSERLRFVRASWGVEDFASVEGEVVRLETTRARRRGAPSRQKLVFRYTVDGRSYTSDNWMTRQDDSRSSLRKKMDEQGHITVYYDPDRPQIATTSRDVSFWPELGRLLLGPAMLIAGLIFLMPWLSKTWHRRRLERKHMRSEEG
jgi:hypothetical protein